MGVPSRRIALDAVEQGCSGLRLVAVGMTPGQEPFVAPTTVQARQSTAARMGDPAIAASTRAAGARRR
jgi:hypothetical protein